MPVSSGAILHANFSKGESAPEMQLQNLPLQSQDFLKEVKLPLPDPLINLDGQRNHLYERLRCFSRKKIWTRGVKRKIEKKRTPAGTDAKILFAQLLVKKKPLIEKCFPREEPVP